MCGLIEYELLSKPMSENTVLNARTALWVRPSSLHYHMKWLGGCSIQAEDWKPGLWSTVTTDLLTSSGSCGWIYQLQSKDEE